MNLIKIAAELEEVKKDLHFKIKQAIWKAGKVNAPENGMGGFDRLLKEWYGVDIKGKSIEEIKQDLLNLSKTLRREENGYFLDGENKNVVKLDNGKYIYFHTGKYDSGLNVLLDNLKESFSHKFEKNDKLTEQFNLDFSGEISFIEGRYFTSRKGSPFFDLTTQNKPHVLVKISWGGAFNDSRGLKTIPKKSLYSRRKCSNGGGLGTDYIIVEKSFQATYSLEDF